MSLCDALFGGAVTFNAGELLLEGLDEVRLCAEQHAAYEVGSRNTRGALDNLETTGLLDESVAVVAIAVGGDVVAVDDVFAAVVGDVWEVGDVGRVGDGAGDPATGVSSSDSVGETVSEWYKKCRREQAITVLLES